MSKIVFLNLLEKINKLETIPDSFIFEEKIILLSELICTQFYQTQLLPFQIHFIYDVVNQKITLSTLKKISPEITQIIFYGNLFSNCRNTSNDAYAHDLVIRIKNTINNWKYNKF